MNSMPRYAIFFAFALSGFIGLVSTSIWAYYFGLFLDKQNSAETIVLSIFAGGSSLGAWLISKHLNRASSPFLCFSACHIVLATSNFFFHWLYVSTVDSNYSSLNLTQLYKLVFCITLILPPSLIFGATLPLLHQGFFYGQSHKHKSNTLKCFINLFLGAALGALVTHIILLQYIGTTISLYLIATISIFIAICSFIFFRYTNRNSKIPPYSPIEIRRPSQLVFITTFATILTLFIYKFAWKETLGIMLGATLQTQGIIYFCLIFALSLGLLFGQGIVSKNKSPTKILSYAQYTASFFALLSLPFCAIIFELTSNLFQSAENRIYWGYFTYTLFTIFSTLVVIFPTTFCIGVVLSILLNDQYKEGLDKYFDSTYSLCGLGILISLIFSYVIEMAINGVNHQILFASLINIFLGSILLTQQQKISGKINSHKHVFVCLSAIALIYSSLEVSLISLTPIYTPKEITTSNSESIFSKRGVITDTDILETTAYDSRKAKHIIKTLFKNGGGDTSVVMSKEGYTHDEVTRVLATAIPLILKPNSTHAAKIGLGTGLPAHVALSNPKLISIETIEPERSILGGAMHFSPRNELFFSDSRSQIFSVSPQNYFPRNINKYDFIVSTELNISEENNLNLFSKDFYQHIKKSLKSDGVFSLWLDLSDITSYTASSIITTLEQVFPFYNLYLATPSDLLIIAAPHKYNLNMGDSIFSTSLFQELEKIGISNISQIASRLVSTEKTLSPMLNTVNAPVNSKYHPVLNFILANDPFESNKNSKFINPTMSGVSYKALIRLGLEEETIQADRLHPFYDIYNLIDHLLPTTETDKDKWLNRGVKLEAYKIFTSPENHCGKSIPRELLWLDSMTSLAKVIHPNASLSKRRVFSQSKAQKKCHEISLLLATKLLIHLQVYVGENDWENSFKTSWRILDEYLKEPQISKSAANYALNNFLLASLILSNEQLASDYLEDNVKHFQLLRDSTTQWLHTLVKENLS